LRGGPVRVSDERLTLVVNPDTVKPTSTASATVPNGTGTSPYNSGDWTNKDVTVSLNATDNTGGSGIKELVYSASGAQTIASTTVPANQLPKQLTINTEGTTTISFHAVDNVGKEEAPEHIFTVKIDKSAPVITDLHATTQPNANGWYNTDVTNNFKASDSGSGLSAACITNFPANGAGENVQSKTTSGEGTTVNVTSDSCTDVAGNSTAGLLSDNFKIDKTKPVITQDGVQSGTVGDSGWYKSDVEYRFKASDGLSGFTGHTDPYTFTKTTTGEGTTAHVSSGTVTDQAGNEALAIDSPDFKIDKKADITSQASANPYSNSSPITVNYTTALNNDLSGLQKVELWAQGPQDSSPQLQAGPKTTANGSFSYEVTQGDGTYRFYTRAVDNAGNEENAPANPDAIVTVTHDTAAPTSTATPDQAANANGWHKANVTVSLNAADGQGSGVKELVYSATGADPSSQQTVSAANLPVNYLVDAEGITTINFHAVDQAGNPEATHTFEVKLDKTAPTITGSRSPAANTHGWNNSDVTVSFTCSDALSGVDSSGCPDNVVVSSEGADQSRSGSVTDKAGNTASATVGNIDIDLTKPILGITDNNLASYDVCGTARPVRPTFNPTDPLSGLLSYSSNWVTPSTTSGVGTYTYSASAEDKANNTDSYSKTYSVVYDTNYTDTLGAYSGILQPVNLTGPRSAFKLGSTVPVKFLLRCGTTPITNAVAKLYLSKIDNVASVVNEPSATNSPDIGN
jgi:hypothetical protein